jgi:hypothetical protein
MPFAGVVLAYLSFAVPVSAQDEAAGPVAEEVSAIDPVAADLVIQSTDFLAQQEHFGFTWFLTSDQVVDGREKITYIESGKIEMQRGDGFVARTERGGTYRDYYYDGSDFTVVSPNEQFYGSVAFKGTYEELVEAARESTGLILPLWTLLTSNLTDRLLAGVDAAEYLGTTLLAGNEVHHIAFSSYERDWQIWISTDDNMPLPLMIIGTESHAQGWPQFRVNLMDWDLSPSIDVSQFSYEPGEGMTPITLPFSGEEHRDEQQASAENLIGQALVERGTR